MKIFHSDDHRLHDPAGELFGGLLVPPHESPRRVDMILDRLRLEKLGEEVAPESFGIEPIRRVHDDGFLAFLQTIWGEWKAVGYEGEVIPTIWPSRRLGALRLPDHPDGKVGYYALAGETAIVEGTWRAARASADVALSAQKAVAGGDRLSFALCRPPGHHAAGDMYGGFCFLNNAAIVAQAFRDQGRARVAVLDVDFHHGNGTQDIFYRRGDVFFASLHGHPLDAFPHFLGYADETGEGPGEGCNANYPLRAGTDFGRWAEALDDACRRIAGFGAEALVVSLGVDTYKDDPISSFLLDSPDYPTVGARIAALGLPTVMVMEGGYAVEDLGVNVANVLKGFLDAANAGGAP